MKIKMRFLRWMVLLTLGIFVNPAAAQNGQAGVPGSFLFMGVGARALGMGGAYTAVANDVTAVFWNPAGLAVQNPFQLSFMHSVLFVDTSLDFLAASAPTERFGSFGVSLISLSSGNFEQRNALNQVTGQFSTRDLAFFISWSKEILPNFSVGLNYKFVNQKILSFSGSGNGFDLGVKAKLFDHLDAGLMLANVIKPKVTLAERSETFPLQFRAGLATELFNDQLTVSIEMSKLNGWSDAILHFGAEYRVMDRLAFRLGANDNNVTFGAGFALDQVQAGYSTSSVSELGSRHQFALSYAFGGFRVGADATPRVFSPAGEMNITRIKLKVKARSAARNWNFIISDASGKIVRQFKKTGQPPEEIVWDGRNSAGSLVSDGEFHYKFDLETVNGKFMTSQGSLVQIDSRGPTGVVSTGEED